ncbi:hypothetical protein AD931_08325 [Gluconobacter oxydans]|uniref:Uncharacterized protein n=1 Tax=Gluconobacter oxydans TaxID=442 RepID=A0AB34XL44_GLUOY|nr:hypothetical protein AD931_08325 [Gluconobacter oxydans]
MAPALPVHDIVDPRPDRHRRHDLSGKSGFLQGLRRLGLALRPHHRDHRLFHRPRDRSSLFQKILQRQQTVKYARPGLLGGQPYLWHPESHRFQDDEHDRSRRKRHHTICSPDPDPEVRCGDFDG